MTAAKLRELEAKATKGPWYCADWTEDDGPNKTTIEAHSKEVLSAGQSSIWPYGIQKTCVAKTFEGCNPLPDAELIAYLRNHAQDFIKLIEAAKRHCVKRMLDDDHELRQALAAFKEKL
jgi:hypothetical protein